MACFLVPMTLAIVLLVLRKFVNKESWEKWKGDWLLLMLWGGVLMLAVEHISHGEVVPWPPFLTAMENPEDTATMLEEMKLIGGSMTLAILGIWAVIVLVINTMKIKVPEIEKA